MNSRFDCGQTIIVDTREHDWAKHPVKRWFDRNGVSYLRSKLPCGDYARMDNLSTVIDRKAGLQEVYSNLIGQAHGRFIREAELAKGHGIRLIVLVQEEDIKTVSDVALWQNPRERRWYQIAAAHRNGKMLRVRIPDKPPVSSRQLQRTMLTVSERHGVEWRFCTAEDYAATVCDILGVDYGKR